MKGEAVPSPYWVLYKWKSAPLNTPISLSLLHAHSVPGAAAGLGIRVTKKEKAPVLWEVRFLLGRVT